MGAILDPHERTDLFKLLAPPENYRLDHMVVTTYSLDLVAALLLPAAASCAPGYSFDDVGKLNELDLFAALKEYSGRMTIFCQAGRIKVPRLKRSLLAFIENSVFEVKKVPNDGAFHPKLTLLRYVSTYDETVVKYRLICASRNLTFENTWDIVMSLEGDLNIDRKNNVKDSVPVGDFIETLADLNLTAEKLPADRLRTLNAIADEVRRVKFETPHEIEIISFIMPGVQKQIDKLFNFEKGILRAVISPFINDDFINNFIPKDQRPILISRPEEINKLSRLSLDRFEKFFVLDEGAVDPELSGNNDEDDSFSRMEGLHAKVFFYDNGWNAGIIAGSANATQAAFNYNIEFSIEFTGKKSMIGFDKFFAEDDKSVTFKRLLNEFTPAPEKVDQRRESLEKTADSAMKMIYSSKLAAICEGPDVEGKYSFKVSVSGTDLKATDNIKFSCAPVTLEIGEFQQFTPGTNPVFDLKITPEKITAFIAFRITATDGDLSITREATLKAELIGAPQDRLDRITNYLIDSEDKLNYIINGILYGIDPSAQGVMNNVRTSEKNAAKNSAFGGEGLLEPLLKAFCEDPDKLKRLAGIFKEVKAGGNINDKFKDRFINLIDSMIKQSL